MAFLRSVLVWTLFALGLLPTGAAQQAEPANDAALAPRHQQFMAQTAFLLDDESRQAFRDLAHDYQRDAFIEAYWRRSDPFPESPRNELRDAIQLGTDAALDQLEDLDSPQAHAMILHGEPEITWKARCDAIRTLDIWRYRNGSVVRGEFHLVFARRGSDWRPWHAADGLSSLFLFDGSGSDEMLYRSLIEECSRGEEIVRALSTTIDTERLLDEAPMLRRRATAEWVTSFLASTTDVPQDADPLRAALEIAYPGRYQSRTVVQALLEVAQEDLGHDEKVARFMVDGEVLRAPARGELELFESFRYRFDLPREGAPDTALALVVERLLRPGAYELVLRVEELNSERYFHQRIPLEVPRVAKERARVIHSELADTKGRAAALEEANQSLNIAEDDDRDGDDTSEDTTPVEAAHRIVLDVPNDLLLTGRTRVRAHAKGNDIARVTFALDGRRVLSKSKPPYSVEIDLGPEPQVHTLAAEAHDASGLLLAEDLLTLNTGPHRFDVRLVEPQPGKGYRRSVRAVAEVLTPALEKLDRVEFFLNETLVATLYQPPWVQPMLIPEGIGGGPDDELAYVRVVATLENETSVEDVVFVNAPDLVDRVDINMVELYVSVVDKKGRARDDLEPTAFVVKEEGEPQTVRRFEHVRDLSVHAGILLDTSTSMEEELDEAEKAALRFFERVLGEKDRACLVTFADAPKLQVPFTGSTEILAGGLAGLEADGETTLWDSLIFTLYYFRGLEGKRALIVISDGEDSNSEYDYDTVLEFARRSGVALYTIALGSDSRQMTTQSRLRRLARDTGGAYYSIETARELTRIYDRIEEEIRSQYLLVYQSTSEAEGYRTVTVEVDERGLETRTVSGYYP